MSPAAHPRAPAPRLTWPALLGLSLLLLACDDADAPASTDDCAALVSQCPLGSNPVGGAQAETRCTGAVGGVVTDAMGQASAQCIGAGSCRVLCQFRTPCRCGIAMLGPEGVICADCEGAAACGDGLCSAGETPETCAVDCGARCAPDERRCDGTDLQVCSLQSRWEVLACPDGEICDAADGPARCVRDPGIIRSDAGVESDMGVTADGRIIDGDADWPAVEPALRGTTPMSTTVTPLSDLFMGGLGAALGATGALQHWRLVPDADQIEAIGTTGLTTVGFDGQVVEPRTFTADAEQFCLDYARCFNSNPPVDCAAFVAEQRDAWGDSTLQCMAERIRDDEDPSACMVLFFGEGCDGRVVAHPDARAFAPAPSVRHGARVAGHSADMTVGVVVDLDERSSYAFDPLPGFRLREKFSFSADGRVVAAVAFSGQDEVVVLWHVDDGVREALLPISGGINRTVALSPDGRVLARVVDRSGDPAQDGNIALWDTATETRIFSIRPDDNASFANLMAFSPDGRTLAVFARPHNEVELWDLVGRQKLHTLVFAPDTIPDSLQFSPDGALLAIHYFNFERALTLWRVAGGQRYFTEPAARAAFSADGRILIVHEELGRDGIGLLADP